MNAQPTQQECRDRFIAEAQRFAVILRTIDIETPACPTTEPTWWLAMSELERRVLATIEAVRP